MTGFILKTNIQESGTSNGDLDTELSELKCDGHFLHIKNQATRKVQSYNVKDVVLEPPVEFWNIDTQFGRAGKYINHPVQIYQLSLSMINDDHSLYIAHL